MIGGGGARGIGMTSQRTRERLVQRLGEAGIDNPRVLNALRHVPRHLFVDEALSSRAYEDSALPIGHGQTVSQPFVVARMTELLVAGQIPGRVLEIGTGSGYQAAVLAQLIGEVYTIERVRALHQRARGVFQRLGLHHVHQRLGDGANGWASKAPFEGIILTAAPESIPDALYEQLADGGRLVAPVGGSSGQTLQVVERRGDELSRRSGTAVSFVPMRGGIE